MGIKAANKNYERWLRGQLGDEMVAPDLTRKHKKMRESVFAFLRATYFRWAETILDVCPDLASAPHVLAVGDIHLENFGTWRDGEGRLVWGVNDFDEAATMPYVIDLVRLATSAKLAKAPLTPSLEDICSHVVDGYEDGLENPQAFVLDRAHMWLRKRFAASEAERTEFWRKIGQQEREVLAKRKAEQPDPRYLKALTSALPDSGVALVLWRRVAGTGSLGRPRWVGYGSWQGGPLLREAKALVPSGWSLGPGRGGARVMLNDIAKGKFRSPDPWYAAQGRVLVRRLSPNNQKLEIANAGDAEELLHPDMLWAMGRELAAVHLGRVDRRDAIRADLAHRKRRWFRTAVASASTFVESEYRDWKKSV